MLFPDWINFRCGVCPCLLHRLCCDFEPRAQSPPTTLFLSHCPTPLLLYTSLKACSPCMPSPNTPHTRIFLMDTRTETHTLTYASAHASKQSYPMCLLRCDGMPEETFHPSICTSLSVQFFQVWRGHLRQRAYNQLN